MSTTHRGKGVKDMPNRGRGTCPICKRTGAKLLYAVPAKNEQNVMVCKICRNKKAATNEAAGE